MKAGTLQDDAKEMTIILRLNVILAVLLASQVSKIQLHENFIAVKQLKNP